MNTMSHWDFIRLAKRALRQTPEYERARAEGRATEWLNREAGSLAYLLAETLHARLLDLDP